MSILKRHQIDRINPNEHGHYQGMLNDLKETVLHYMELAAPELGESDKMKVMLFQDDDGNVECYCGKWIRVEVHKPEYINDFPDEELPVWMSKAVLSRPNYSRNPNLTTEQCLHEFIDDRKIQRERREFVIEQVASRQERETGPRQWNEVTQQWEWQEAET